MSETRSRSGLRMPVMEIEPLLSLPLPKLDPPNSTQPTPTRHPSGEGGYPILSRGAIVTVITIRSLPSDERRSINNDGDAFGEQRLLVVFLRTLDQVVANNRPSYCAKKVPPLAKKWLLRQTFATFWNFGS